jgi:hypothetical protein
VNARSAAGKAKSEIRNPKSETIPKKQKSKLKAFTQGVLVIASLSFGFVSDFGFGIYAWDV